MNLTFDFVVDYNSVIFVSGTKTPHSALDAETWIGSEPMDQPVFDAATFVKFDLTEGTIRSVGEEQLALVPPEVLAALNPGTELNEAGREWGSVHGKRLATALAEKESAPGVDVLAEHLCGTAATLGLGRLSVEIHGDALTFRVHTETTGSPGTEALLGAFIAGYLSVLTPNSYDVFLLDRVSGERLYWAGNSAAVQKVRRWIDDGIDPLAAIQRLTEGSE